MHAGRHDGRRVAHIGLIGGLGPAATVAYYERLCAAAGDRPIELTIVQVDRQAAVARLRADRREEQAEAFLRLIRRLEDAGADCAAITSLGGHFCFEETRARSPLPLVSAIEPLDEAFVARGFARVGLLGTAVVMRTRLYGQLRRTEAVVLDADVEELGELYLSMALSGEPAPGARTRFLDAGRRLTDAGAEAVVLAGTDLGLVFDGVDPGYPVIDALDIHVARLADLALGRATL